MALLRIYVMEVNVRRLHVTALKAEDFLCPYKRQISMLRLITLR